MRPPNVRAPRPPMGKQLREPIELAPTAVRPLDVADIKAIVAMDRPTRVRLVVFDPRRAGRIMVVRHFDRREPAIAAAERVSGLPTAVVVDGPDR